MALVVQMLCFYAYPLSITLHIVVATFYAATLDIRKSSDRVNHYKQFAIFAITTLAIIAVFVEYLRQFLIDLHQTYRHSSVP